MTIFLVIAIVEFAGMAVYYEEQGAPGASIVSAQDSIWWGLVTITTVGYGDMVPVTTGGRVVGVFLLFAGIALFSVLTGFIANFFLAPRSAARGEDAEPGTVIAELDALRALLADQEERAALIRAKLVDIEHAVAMASTGPVASSADRS
jgi:voltage-gated potassium channel